MPAPLCKICHVGYLAHHLEKMGLILGFIYFEILELLESFESTQMNLLAKLG